MNPAPSDRPAPARVLILTASVGAGHDRPAETLTEQLREEEPEIDVVVADGLAAMGRAVVAVSESAPRVVFFRFDWLWDLGFWAFARFAPTRRATQAILMRFGAEGLLRLVRVHRPDVVVSTYPQTTEVLGRLRRGGRLDVPVCAAVTDLSALWYWATPGADVHLVTHPESVEEVRAIAGPTARVYCVTGFTDRAFLEPRSADEARSALGLPDQGAIVLVSGGGWGVGRLDTAVETALGLPQVRAVVCLCGRNDALRERLRQRFGAEPRVQVEGFTEQMAEWLAAGDALVHSTAGLTILEALIRACPPISFGWGRGHIRMNNAAFLRFGLAAVAETEAELASALARALETRPAPDLTYAERITAASVVLAEARDRAGRSEDDARRRHERERNDEHRAAERSVAPVLSADERREKHGDGDLHRHHGGPDA
jgi:UDP-N-acetylglucosamine:LPS N-acetylglucosamine transferase